MPGVARKQHMARGSGAVVSPAPTTQPQQPSPFLTPLPLSKNIKFGVCIDYGTTWTSVAYHEVTDTDRNNPTFAADLRRVKEINAYPGVRYRRYVPTEIAYDLKRPAQANRWGFEVENSLDGLAGSSSISPDIAVVRLAKLLLHESDETRKEREMLEIKAQEIKKKCGCKPDFVADFLRKLHGHILAELRKVCLTTLPEGDDIDECIEWVICVPAAWLEGEQRKMVEAAEAAGIRSPSLVSEPEAAALVVLLEENSDLLKDGDTFVVCDGGGGTVDIMTYNIIQRQPLQLRETAVGEGILCGSTYLNKNFDSLLKEKLALETNLAAERLDDVIKQAHAVFDTYKKSFAGPGSDPVNFVTERGDTTRGFYRERMTISSEEVRDRVFQPIVDRIRELLKRQIEESERGVKADPDSRSQNRGAEPAKVKSIILTGGLGDNPYLFEELKQTFWEEPSPGNKIVIKKPDIAKSAVARGGLILGFNGAGVIKERRSRFSYGFDIAVPYVSGKHSISQRRKDVNSGGWFIDRVEWAVKKNQPIREGQVIRLPDRYRNIAESLIDQPVEDVLVVSKKIRNGITWKGGLSRAEETYTFKTGLSRKSLDALNYKVSEETGERYYHVNYHIEMRISSVKAATFEFVTHLPNGDFQRQSISRPFKCDTNIASLQMRQVVGPPRRVHHETRERKTFSQIMAESSHQQKRPAKRRRV